MAVYGDLSEKGAILAQGNRQQCTATAQLDYGLPNWGSVPICVLGSHIENVSHILALDEPSHRGSCSGPDRPESIDERGEGWRRAEACSTMEVFSIVNGQVAVGALAQP